LNDGLVIADRYGREQSNFKRGKQPKLGPAHGYWSGERVQSDIKAPFGGLGAMLQFNLDSLTLSDYRQMRDHYQVNASMTLLTFMLHQMDWSLECDNKKIKEEMEEMMRGFWTRMIRALSQAFWAGFSPMVLEFDNHERLDNRVTISKFKDLVPERTRVNWKEVKGARPPGATGIKNKFYVYDGIKQDGRWEVPVEYTFWYPLLMENGNYYGKKLLRPAFPSWFFSQLMHLFSNRYFERFGEPVPIGRAPFEDEIELGDGTTIDGRTAMENILTQLRNRSVVVLPDNASGPVGPSGRRDFDYQIEYLESQMRGADFDRYIERLDEEISLALMTPVMLMRTTSGGGGYNQGVQHLQTYLWLLNALQGDIKEYVDRYVLRRLKDINYGPKAAPVTLKPRAMGRENVETVRAIVQELVRGGAVKPDVFELGQAVGLKLEELGELQIVDPVKLAEIDAKNQQAMAEQKAKEAAAAAAANPNGPADSRVGGPPRDKPKRSGPRGVNQPRQTTRNIAARIAPQVTKAFSSDRSWEDSHLSLGYQKAMVDAYVAEGADPDRARELVTGMYESVNKWWDDVRSVPRQEFEGPEQLVEMVTNVLDGNIDAHVEPS
jgi:hypothetical protein